MGHALWWIRRDLRLSDNPALQAALAGGRTVIPLYILDPHQVQFPAAKRQAFLFASLRRLDADLRARGSRLVIREGNALDVLQGMAAETQAEAIVAQESYSPYARQRDAAVADVLPLKLVAGLTVHHPTWVVKDDGRPYTVFTPFSRAWKMRPLPGAPDLLAAPTRLGPVPPGLGSDKLPEANPPLAFPPGEQEAQRRLLSFVEGEPAPIHAYDGERDRMDHPGTSALSPYLRFGMLSARQAVVAALSLPLPDGRGAADLAQRADLARVLHAHPVPLSRCAAPEPSAPACGALPGTNDAGAFAAWCAGRTGFPIVDAAMRQLAQTGWMHNRARMIVASFLVKDLLVDWRWGERWFMQHLVDGDPAANNGGWQWTAGTGTDAAPYFRIFNPVLQGQKFDPQGAYVRRWLPELAARARCASSIRPGRCRKRNSAAPAVSSAPTIPRPSSTALRPASVPWPPIGSHRRRHKPGHEQTAAGMAPRALPRARQEAALLRGMVFQVRGCRRAARLRGHPRRLPRQ